MKYLRLWALGIGLWMTLPAGAQTTESIRAWQFHALDTAYMYRALAVAPDYEVNTFVFSHGAIGYTQQLYDQSYVQHTKSERGRQLEAVARDANQQGIACYIWIHELGDIPAQFMQEEKVNLDDKGLWKYLSQRYEQVFEDYPTFKGVMLTFHETHHKIFDDDEVSSTMTKPARFVKLINLINKACQKYNRQLIVRSFLYQQAEYDWFAEGLKSVPEEVLLQIKCVPNDWQPYFPHNALIGQFPNRKQIIEYDASAEYMGRNFMSWAAPQYFQYRWRYAAQFDHVIGYNVRLDHAGYDALFDFNSLNIYAISLLERDPQVTVDDIWEGWLAQYEQPARAPLREILEPTFDIINRLYFPHKVWFGNHSKLTHFEYGLHRVPYLAHWDKAYKPLTDRLLQPDYATYLDLVAEKDTAIALAQESLWKLYEYQDLFNPCLRQKLQEQLLFQLHFSLLARSNIKLFFGTLLAQQDSTFMPMVRKELEVFRRLGAAIPVSQVQRDKNYLLDPLVVEKVAKSIEKQLMEMED